MRGCIVSSLITIAFSCATAVSLSADEKKYHFPPGRAAMIYKPRIEYPYEARKAGITGRGVVALEIDKATGTVTKAYMLKSTGSRILDDAAISAFRTAKFAGAIHSVKIPIQFGGVPHSIIRRK
jgi:TonB family protein